MASGTTLDRDVTSGVDCDREPYTPARAAVPRLEVVDADDTVDAVNNWRGCADGPDDTACDDVVGDADYDPWLTSPVADVGAS